MEPTNRKRAAAMGMAGVLALGTVASLGAITPVSAARTTYTCTLPVAGGVDFPVRTASPLPDEVLRREVIRGHPEKVRVTLPAGAVKVLTDLGYTSVSGSVTDTAYRVGSGSLPLKGLATPGLVDLPDSGSLTLPLVGRAGRFTAPSALGSLPVRLPKSFTFVPADANGPISEVSCVLKDGASARLGTTEVVSKYSSRTTAKWMNAPITTGERPRVAVRVRTGNGDPAVGSIIATHDGHVVGRGTLNDAGKKVLTISRLTTGTHHVVIRYQGNKSTKPSRKTLNVTVRR